MKKTDEMTTEDQTPAASAAMPPPANAEHPMPSEGGSYIRKADGSLEKQEG